MFSTAILACTEHYQSLSIVASEHKLLQYKEKEEVIGPSAEILKLLLNCDSLVNQTQMMPWSRAYKLAKQQPNTLIYSIVRTKDREPHFHWITKVSELVRAFVYQKDKSEQKIQTIAQAKTKLIAVVRDSYSYYSLKKLGFSEQDNLYIVTTTKQAISLLMKNKVDLLFTDPDVMENYFASSNDINRDNLGYTILPQTRRDSYIALNKQSAPSMVKKLMEASQGLLKSKSYHQLLHHKPLLSK